MKPIWNRLFFLIIVGIVTEVFTTNHTNERTNICKFVLENATGSLSSPGYLGLYPNNLNCSWLISQPEGCTIQMSFTDLFLESGYDYLTAYDGNSSWAAVLGTWTGAVQPFLIQSTNNYMLLRLHTDEAISGTGFVANYTTSCLQAETTVARTASHHKTTEKSPDETIAPYRFHGRRTTDMPDGSSSTYRHYGTTTPSRHHGRRTIYKSYWTTTPSRHHRSSPTYRHYGTTTPSRHHRSSPTYRHYGTTTSSRYHGTTTPSRHQGKRTTYKPYGTTTPSRHHGTTTSSRPHWTTTPSRHHRSSPTYRHYRTTTSSTHLGTTTPSTYHGTTTPSRHHGKRTIYKTYGTTTTSRLHRSSPTYRHYGTTTPSRHHRSSPTYRHYRTGMKSTPSTTVGRARPHRKTRGISPAQNPETTTPAWHRATTTPRWHQKSSRQSWYQTTSSAYLGTTRRTPAADTTTTITLTHWHNHYYLTHPQGFLASPNFPLKYPNNMQSWWSIEVLDGCTINLTFQQFELEKNSDILTIYDGPNTNATSVRYTGLNLPAPFQSKTRHVLIEMKTDMSVQFAGFYAEYSESCPTTPVPPSGVSLKAVAMNLFNSLSNITRTFANILDQF